MLTILDILEPEKREFPRIYNRMEDNFHLSNKKALFWNFSEYYKSMNKNPWDALPVTFHVEDGLNDLEYLKFLEYHKNLTDEISNKTLKKQRKLEEEERKRCSDSSLSKYY